MHDQNVAAVEAGLQVFRAPPEVKDAPALQPLDEPLGKRKPQVRPPLLDTRDHRPRQHRLEPPPHRLDLGQLGHQRSSSRCQAKVASDSA